MSDTKTAEKTAEQLADEAKGLQKQWVDEIEKGQEKNAERLELLDKKLEDVLPKLEKALEKKHEMVSVPGTGVDKGANDPDYNFGLACLASRMQSKGDTNAWDNVAPYEKEVNDAAWEQWRKVQGSQMVKMAGYGEVNKAMGISPESAGGILVPMQVQQADFIPLLRAFTIVMPLGAREFNNITGIPLRFRRKKSGVTAQWIEENPASSVTATDLALEPLDLRPRRTAARTTHSEDLAEFASPDAGSLILEDHAEVHALAIDNTIFNGTGGKMPVGLDVHPGVQDYTWTASAAADYANYTDLLAMERLLANVNGLKLGVGVNANDSGSGTVGWAMHPNVFYSLRQIKSENLAATNDSGEVSRVVISAPAPNSIVGWPFGCSTQLNGTSGSARVFFGKWNEIMIANFSALIAKTTDAVGEAAARFQFDVITSKRIDAGIRHADMFVKSDEAVAIN